MNIDSSMIFYWLKKEFPQAIHQNPGLFLSEELTRPIFYRADRSLTRHIVVIQKESCGHFAASQADFLPIYLSKTKIEFLQNGLPAEAIWLPDTADVSKVFNTLQDICDQFESWQKELEEAVNRLFSFDAIVRSCDALLEEPLALTDSHFRYVSFSWQLAQKSGYAQQYVNEGNFLPMEYINQLTAMPDFKETEEQKGVYQYPLMENMLHKNIFYQGAFVGRLGLPDPADAAKQRYYYSILQRVGQYVEALYDIMGSFWHRRGTTSRISGMLRDLLDGKAVELDVLDRLLCNQGYVIGDEFQLIQMKSYFTTNESKLTAALTSQLEKIWAGSCCMTYGQELLVFLNLSQFRRTTNKLFNQALAVFLRESLLLAGLSRTFQKITDIRAAYQQTCIAMEAGQDLTPTYWYFKYDDYAYWNLLHHGCGNFLPEQVCHPAINILMAYDEANNTELCRTLKTYLDNQYNAVSTANALYIARSTFLKRLTRIVELTNLDLNNAQQRLYVALSFALFNQ